MPYCYYTCNLIPLDLAVRGGYSPRWLGNHLRDASAPVSREALAVHPMTCPYVTKLVAAAEAVLGSAPAEDCLLVPGGCDAMRRMGDLLAASYPDRVFVLPVPRSSGPGSLRTLAADLRRLEEWLAARLLGASGSAPGTPEPPHVDYPSAPRPHGVFLISGPLSDDSLLRLVEKLGAHVSGLESCTSPDRWKPLAITGSDSPDPPSPGSPVAEADPDTAGNVLAPRYEALAAQLLAVGMCPRRSTTDRREYLAQRLDETQPSCIINARQSFCDPGAYDALLVAQMAKERGLPYLEIEVDFPFDAGGPLQTRVEAFLEAQLLDDDLLSEED